MSACFFFSFHSSITVRVPSFGGYRASVLYRLKVYKTHLVLLLPSLFFGTWNIQQGIGERAN